MIGEIAKIIVENTPKETVDSLLTIESKANRIGAISYAIADSIHPFAGFFSEAAHVFNGKYYEKVSDGDFASGIRLGMKALGFQPQDVVLSADIVKKHCVSTLRKYKLRPERHLISFNNAVYDVKSKVIMAHDKDHHVISSMGYDYKKDADCELFKKFLDEVLPDKELQMILQEYLGLIFYDRSELKIEKIMYLVGTGSNGKSVIFEIVNSLVGNKNISNYDVVDLVGARSDCMYNMADLDGKWVNYCTDMNDKNFSDGKAKALFSGEPQQCRPIRQEPYTARNIPIFIANVNALPNTSDHSDGYYRRNLIIPFEVRITKEKRDKNLHTKLKKELPGIFNWVTKGLDRILENNGEFTRSRAAVKAVREYKLNTCTASAFMSDEFYFPDYEYKGDEKKEIKSNILYTKYKNYCIDNGHHPLSVKKFSQTLVNNQYEKEARRDGNFFIVFKRSLEAFYFEEPSSLEAEF